MKSLILIADTMPSSLHAITLSTKACRCQFPVTPRCANLCLRGRQTVERSYGASLCAGILAVVEPSESLELIPIRSMLAHVRRQLFHDLTAMQLVGGDAYFSASLLEQSKRFPLFAHCAPLLSCRDSELFPEPLQAVRHCTIFRANRCCTGEEGGPIARTSLPSPAPFPSEQLA